MDERRHSDILYLTSIENFHQTILDRLPEGSIAPSSSWLYMDFWPSNQYHNSASLHTGQIKLKFKMQQWLVSGQHPDTYLLLSHVVQVSENYGSKALEIYINVFC